MVNDKCWGIVRQYKNQGDAERMCKFTDGSVMANTKTSTTNDLLASVLAELLALIKHLITEEMKATTEVTAKKGSKAAAAKKSSKAARRPKREIRNPQKPGHGPKPKKHVRKIKMEDLVPKKKLKVHHQHRSDFEQKMRNLKKNEQYKKFEKNEKELEMTGGKWMMENAKDFEKNGRDGRDGRRGEDSEKILIFKHY
ncbi:hypothetical protein L5515_013659 [Caenorhabditis briggsae]|uniref:Uncharacterized protein n=1 Tax=Caenorhabditis briggsae TaxID=6238 RepID=A0AAE9J5R3_CAEBR|nr:hypothetical protein L5515_013659 [Caenorhabditis briggsae]